MVLLASFVLFQLIILTKSFYINLYSSKKGFLRCLKHLNCDNNNQNEDEYSRSNSNRRGAPAKTGSHTYTSWIPLDLDREILNEAINNENGKDEDNGWANSVIDVDTANTNNKESVPSTTTTRAESQRTTNIPPSSPPPPPQQQQQQRPIQQEQGADWFTDIGNRIFDSFFFYGIDSGLPEENEKRGGFNRKRMDKKSKRKSPFFTSGEILAEDLINSNPSSSTSSSRKRSKNDVNYYLDIGSEDDQRNNQRDQNSMKSMKTIQQLNDNKYILENELEILKVSIETADVMNTDEDTLRSWKREKDVIESKIDEIQIQIVNLSLP